MASSQTSTVGLILFTIAYCCCVREVTSFTRFNHELVPAVVNGQRLYTYYYDDNTAVVTSAEAGYEECNISGIVPPGSRHQLGNGKMVAFTTIYTHFSILDFKTCSTHSVKHVSDGTAYQYEQEKEVHAVVPYYDTFDVFALNSFDCRPCRYNDKGERLELNDKLKFERGDPNKFYLAPLKNMSGVDGGYLYAVSYRNDTTILKVLDSKYKVVKEKISKGQFKGFSLTHDHITVCYTVDACPDRWFDCYTLKCQILDSNLDTTATATMHQPSNNQYSSVRVRIQNLEDGGAMVSTEFDYYKVLSDTGDQEVFIQQIHANGRLESAIHVDTFHAEFVSISDFMSNNGEYCLLTAIEEKGDKGFSLLKCVIPKKS